MMRTFQFDLNRAIFFYTGAEISCALSSVVHSVSRRSRREKTSSVVNIPGLITSKVEFIVENHDKRCLLTSSIRVFPSVSALSAIIVHR